jgi:membrane-bound lytic murein transglycosylase D
MTDGWFRTLRNLNPRLDPQAQQPVGTHLQLPKQLESAYASRCVDGPWPILANDLHNATVPVVAQIAAPVHASAASRDYKVRRGDTLESIVRKLHCSSVQEVADMNGIKHQHLSLGQTLKLPVCQ